MSGGVPAGDVAAIVSLLGDIAMWSGNQKLTEKAFALSQQIATPTPPPSRDADVERVRDWRAIAKLAGEHGIRYRTNTALVQFLAALEAIGERP